MKKALLGIFYALMCVAAPAQVVFTLDSDATPSASTFSDVRAAIGAINAAAQRGVKSVTLQVAPGVYWLDDPDDPAERLPREGESIPYGVEITVDTLRVTGLADDPRDVVWAVNRGQTQGALGNYTMIHFNGQALELANMTLGNYCNADLDYPRNPALSRPKRREAIVQAQIGICNGTDRLLARNCRFISRLNMCPMVGARRSLYKDCYMECTDDALSGSAVYQDCSFTFFSGKPFYNTERWGAVMLNCDIRSLTEGTQYITKAAGQVALVDVRFTGSDSLALGWGLYRGDVMCYHSNVTLNGRPASPGDVLTGTDMTGDRLLDAYKIVMPDGAVIYNTAGLLAGDDGWDPLGVRPAVEAAERTLGRRLLGLPVCARRLVDKKPWLAPEGENCDLEVALERWGGYEMTDPAIAAEAWEADCRWDAPDVVAVATTAGGSARVTSRNRFPRAMDARVTGRSGYGLQLVATLGINPLLKDAPAIEGAPSVTVNRKNHTATVAYKLSPWQAADMSRITWHRVMPDGRRIPLTKGNGGAGATYTLTPGDEGCMLEAEIVPQGDDTRPGATVVASLGRKVAKLDVGVFAKQESAMTADFARLPITHQPHVARGAWTLDAYKPADTERHEWMPQPDNAWYYGHGADAATGIGLVQATRGARAFYTPCRDRCTDMAVALEVEPAKGAGQGFGSATGQYLDIYVKYDPATMTGYGLRIERVATYDKAVTFTLMRWDGGVATPLCDPQPSSCYRTTCSIRVAVEGDRLTATARTTAKPVASWAAEVTDSVSLSAPVPRAESTATSLGLQHTGTTGSSATLIRSLSATWR